MALVLVACSGESQFPEPNGRGTFRAVNAIADSPAMVFQLEESPSNSDVMNYRDVSRTRRFDGFEYNFNFEIVFAGDNERTRVATETRNLDADRDFTFVATGDAANPTILTWETAERFFDGSETIFQLQLAHLAESVGTVDVYFAPPGTAPVLGEKAGTLAYGEILPPVDYTAGNYVLTATPPDDPATILFQSNSISYSPVSAYILPLFDGTADENSAVVGRALSTTVTPGNSLTMRDNRSSPSIQFTQASPILDTVDVYDDEALTNRVVEALPFKDTTPPVLTTGGITTLRYTPTGNTGVVLLESTFTVVQGVKYEFYSYDISGEQRGGLLQRDRRPISIYGTFSLFNTVSDRAAVDVYIVEPGASLDDAIVEFELGLVDVPLRVPLAAGDYEAVITVEDEETPLAPRLAFTLANGDALAFIALPTPDPNVIEIQPVP